jgi:hypothetical protein
MHFKKFLENDLLDDLFTNFKHQPVVRRQEKIEFFTLPLYRGFNGNLNNLHTEGDYYIFSPGKSEQGMLWFTHPYIRHYDAVEYAKNHGKYYFEYPLLAKKHIEVEHHEDGSTSNGIPKYFSKMANPTENSRFHMGIELPKGFVFSYKTEKFIGCTIKIKVKKEDVVES